MRIRNWRKYQRHHDGRKTPWIKLHVEMLQSRDWIMWDDASRVLAIVCILVASQRNGEVPDDPEYVRRLAYLSDVNFKPLLDSGFLEVTESDKERHEVTLSTSTSTSRKGGVEENQSPEKYAFESGVIRLKEDAYQKWRRAFSHLSLDAELIGVTDWASRQPNWFVAVSSFLTKKDREVRVELEKAKANGGFKYMSGIEGVI